MSNYKKYRNTRLNSVYLSIYPVLLHHVSTDRAELSVTAETAETADIPETVPESPPPTTLSRKRKKNKKRSPKKRKAVEKR